MTITDRTDGFTTNFTKSDARGDIMRTEEMISFTHFSRFKFAFRALSINKILILKNELTDMTFKQNKTSCENNFR